MQRLPDGSFRFSPRDLISFLEGDFAAWCDRNHSGRSGGTGGQTSSHDFVPDEKDPEMELLARRGDAHEAAHLDRLRTSVPNLAKIARVADGDESYDETLRAMQDGAPVIFQGELRAAQWRGFSDFLHRKDGASKLGDYFYEPWDTKLARSAKPYFLLQLCAYAEMLEAMQGIRPEQFGFVFGDQSEATFRTEDVWHYYKRLKRSFETFHAEWSADQPPDPSLDRTHGRWSTAAERLLTDRDDLSLVAGIRRNQIVRLRDGGIETLTALATSTAPTVTRMNVATFDNVRAQAAMQLASRSSGTIKWDYRATDPARPYRGLALLPPRSPNDVFFDIEGFPYAIDGLEYLLGVVTVDEGTMQFRDWWAHDEPQEKRAFEQFIDWACARWQADKTLHIYHYAAYERTAMGRLMGKYATREFEVDELFRNEVLVDLYPIVLQGMVIGTPSYSLKDVEHLYMPDRDGDVTSAGGSVVEYQRWLDSGESPDPAASPILDAIRSYNKVDCESTVGLRDWLLARQDEAGIAWIAPPDRAVNTKAPVGPTPAEELAARLIARAETQTEDSEEQRITLLLAWLLEFHRREEKPWWWKYFDRMKASDDRLYDDIDCLAGLVRTDTPSRVIKKSTGHEYRFDPDQDTKLRDGDKCALAGTLDEKCSIERFVDPDNGIIELKVGPGKTLPPTLSLIPCDLITTDPLKDGILRFVTRWSENPDCHPALADLIARRAPAVIPSAPTVIPSAPTVIPSAPTVIPSAPTVIPSAARNPHQTLINPEADLAQQSIDIARRLNSSTLCIQGPPGSGKTTTAAEIILALIEDGKKIGIVANSHDVVLNLMQCVADRGEKIGINPRLVKVGGDNDHQLLTTDRAQQVESKAAADTIAAGPLLIGATAWCFAREDMEATLDYLFIEEAGQFSLANAVAVGSSAKNLILLGDQMQLSQPTQGSHPGESGLSALEYFLHGHATVPPDRGIFLGLSYRMHPDVCSLISVAYYEGRLESAEQTKSNRIIGGAGTSIGLDAGVRFVPVDHVGCAQESEEEVDAIADIVRELLECSVIVKEEPPRPMTLQDILIVAPFNMQVRSLKRRLGALALVGTVDKFQGQQAPVVIMSMCASTLDDAPRGPKFLLSRNRLNVAISRAQALAIVVGSRELGNVRAKSVDEMQLVSGWCRIERLLTTPRIIPTA